MDRSVSRNQFSLWLWRTGWRHRCFELKNTLKTTCGKLEQRLPKKFWSCFSWGGATWAFTSLPHHLPMNSIQLLSLNTAEVTKPRRQHIRDGRGTGNLVRLTLWGNSVDIWWLRFFKASKHENKKKSGWCEPQILETIKTRVHGFTSTNTWWDASCCLYMARRIVLSRVAREWAEKQLNTYQNQLGVEVTRKLWLDSIL